LSEERSYQDRELFTRIAGGDEDAFAMIFHEYNARLFPTVLKMVKSQTEAEEIIQNVFLRVWLKRDQLPEIEKPGAWLFRIASNLALSFLRDKATYWRHAAVAAPASEEDDEILQLSLDAKELRHLIAEAAGALPEARRQIFTLSRFEGLSRPEIAQQLGLAESTVKNQLTSSLRFIQEYIFKKYGIQLPLIILAIIF
jgi:RNA polymerase sigma-70 factor (family 1)